MGRKTRGDAGWEKEEKKLWKEKRENFDTENIFPVVMMLYDEHIDFCTSFYHFINKEKLLYICILTFHYEINKCLNTFSIFYMY